MILNWLKNVALDRTCIPEHYVSAQPWQSASRACCGGYFTRIQQRGTTMTSPDAEPVA